MALPSTAVPAPVAEPPERFNFAEYLFRRNAGRAAALAYLDDHGSLTYGALEHRARCLAAALLAKGLRREERVLLLMLDCCDWPVSFLGAIYAGLVPVAVNTLLTAADYRYLLGHSRAQAALVSGALLPVLRDALSSVDDEAGPQELRWVAVAQPVARVDSSGAAGSAGAGAGEAGGAGPAEIGFETLLAEHPPLAAAAATGRDEPAFWLYSSGSTGRPKGTVHTQANPYWTARLFGSAVLGLSESDICFSAAKLYFAYGLGNALTFPLEVGATTVLMAGRPTPEAVFRRWVDHRPTVFFGAPTGYAGLLASPMLPAREQVALRLASSAGEALPAEIGERFTRHFGIDLIDGIGSTEMLHVYLSNQPGRVRYGSTGWPVPGYQIELRGESGAAVPDGEPGDLYVRGPSAALMYWGNREKSRETFLGPWTRSGDKYLRNSDGSFTYAGRSDDMLKISGIYVSPFEVEATLIQHPRVLEAAVIGVSDADGLTRTKAFVVLKPAPGLSNSSSPAEADPTEAELQAFIKDRLAPYKYPRQIEFVTELPKTATGKIQRFRLRESEAARAAR